jgi:hypothetical protein
VPPDQAGKENMKKDNPSSNGTGTAGEAVDKRSDAIEAATGGVFTSQKFGRSQGFQEQLRARTTPNVRAKKPRPADFFRIHPDYELNCYAIELKDEQDEFYLVSDQIAEMLTGGDEPELTVTYRKLLLYLTRQNVVGIWAIKTEDLSGKLDSYSVSALECAQTAKHTWIRIVADRHCSRYRMTQAMSDFGEPRWPNESFEKLIDLAYKGKLIEGYDHPVLLNLRGEKK